MKKNLNIKLREKISNTTANEISVNLANTYMMLGRFPDAIHTYQTCLKLTTFIPQLNDKLNILFDNISSAAFYNKMYNDSVYYLKKALQFSPSSVNSWFNIALAREENAVDLLNKFNKSVQDIEFAVKEFKVAHKIFQFIFLDNNFFKISKFKLNKSKVNEHKVYCEVIFINNTFTMLFLII